MKNAGTTSFSMFVICFACYRPVFILLLAKAGNIFVWFISDISHTLILLFTSCHCASCVAVANYVVFCCTCWCFIQHNADFDTMRGMLPWHTMHYHAEVYNTTFWSLLSCTSSLYWVTDVTMHCFTVQVLKHNLSDIFLKYIPSQALHHSIIK